MKQTTDKCTIHGVKQFPYTLSSVSCGFTCDKFSFNSNPVLDLTRSKTLA